MRELGAKFLKFASVGGVATGFQYVLMILFIEGFHVVPLHASVLSYFVSSVFNYWANYHFTFSSSLSHKKTFPKFALVAGSGLILNAMVFHAAYTTLDGLYLLAQVVATICVLLWNFAVNHFWSFSDTPRHGDSCE
jgi:putative flippase GtrA